MSANAYTHKAMASLAPQEQAKQALAHLLVRIRDDERLRHLIGMGSETFALATEAYSTLSGCDLAELRRNLEGGA